MTKNPPIKSFLVPTGATKSARQKLALFEFFLLTCCRKKNNFVFTLSLLSESNKRISSPSELAGQKPKTHLGFVIFSLINILIILFASSQRSRAAFPTILSFRISGKFP